MKENKLLETDLSIKGFNLYKVNLNTKDLKDKRGYGVIQYEWFDKGSFKVVVRTGFKKDIVLSDEFNENYKRLLLKSVENKRVPFFVNKTELEEVDTNTSIYGFMYSLRENELKKIGNEGIRFGIWPEGVKNYEPVTRSVIECNFLYSEKKGTFFSGANNVEFFLPKRESLRYYSKHMDRGKYFSLLKSLKLLLNLAIINLKNLTVEEVVALARKDQKVLLKRLMVLEWLLKGRINSLLGLLDNDSWAWRYNFYYLQSYIKELVGFLGGTRKILLSFYKLNLDERNKKLVLYRLQKKEASEKGLIGQLTYAKNLSDLSNKIDYTDMNKNYFLNVLNKVLKDSIRKTMSSKFEELEVSKQKSTVQLHLVSSLDHFFKKSVVSVRSLRKVNKKIWRYTKVKAIRGLIFQNEVKPIKDYYKTVLGLRLKKRKQARGRLKEDYKEIRKYKGNLKEIIVSKNRNKSR